jgi:predicted nucleotidyltransferase
MRLMDGVYFLSPLLPFSDTDVLIITSPTFKKSKYLSDIKMYLLEVFK